MINVADTLVALCKYPNIIPIFPSLSPILTAVTRLIQNNLGTILIGACSILSYFTSSSYGRIQEVVDAGVVPRLYELLDHPEAEVALIAFRIINNIVSGSSQTRYSNVAAGA